MLTVPTAAAAILDLINSRPRNPTLAELEAVLSRACPHLRSASGSHERLAAQIREAMPPLRAAFEAANETLLSAPEYPALDEHDHLLRVRFDALCAELWTSVAAAASPDTEDLVLLAEVAQFEAYDWPKPHPEIPLTEGDYIDGCPARLALGHLAIAVLKMGGRRHA